MQPLLLRGPESQLTIFHSWHLCNRKLFNSSVSHYLNNIVANGFCTEDRREANDWCSNREQTEVKIGMTVSACFEVCRRREGQRRAVTRRSERDGACIHQQNS